MPYRAINSLNKRRTLTWFYLNRNMLLFFSKTVNNQSFVSLCCGERKSRRLCWHETLKYGRSVETWGRFAAQYTVDCVMHKNGIHVLAASAMIAIRNLNYNTNQKPAISYLCIHLQMPNLYCSVTPYNSHIQRYRTNDGRRRRRRR